jgi:hypothetical protein
MALYEENNMSIKIGPFFELIAVKSAIDEMYPGGAKSLVEKIGLGEIDDYFVGWGTMGSDTSFNEVIDELRKAGLNCDEDDVNCVYVFAAHHQAPKQKKSWFTSSKDSGGKAWLHIK